MEIEEDSSKAEKMAKIACIYRTNAFQGMDQYFSNVVS